MSDTNELDTEIENMVDEYRSAVLLASHDLTNDKVISLVAYAVDAILELFNKQLIEKPENRFYLEYTKGWSACLADIKSRIEE